MSSNQCKGFLYSDACVILIAVTSVSGAAERHCMLPLIVNFCTYQLPESTCTQETYGSQFVLQDVFNLLPNLSVEELLRSFAIKSNDMMLAVYLASMIRR